MITKFGVIPGQKKAEIVATGGTISTSGGHKYHVFTGSGTFNLTTAPDGVLFDIQLVGGGGSSSSLGGGGAGQVTTLTGKTLTTGSYTVTVGSAGNASIVSAITGARAEPGYSTSGQQGGTSGSGMPGGTGLDSCGGGGGGNAGAGGVGGVGGSGAGGDGGPGTTLLNGQYAAQGGGGVGWGSGGGGGSGPGGGANVTYEGGSAAKAGIVIIRYPV